MILKNSDKPLESLIYELYVLQNKKRWLKTTIKRSEVDNFL